MSNDINIVQVDPQELINTTVRAVEAASGDTLYPTDMRTIFIKQLTPVIVAIYAAINDTAKQSLLRYARGEMLDAIGEMANTTRLQPQHANCQLEFTLSSGHPDITIPAGMRVSPDGILFFSTDEAVTIAANVNIAQVRATAIEAGSRFNGLISGQIKLITDPKPWVASVSNTTVTAGGFDLEEDGDTDPPYSGYRARIREAPASFSTAGSEGAYIYWAKTASQDIISVSVKSPSESDVVLTILAKDGAPSQDILNSVLAACSARDVRPVTDRVTVQAARFVDFTISLSYIINSSYASSEAMIRAAMEGPNGAIQQYIKWQTSEIGRSISSAQLYKFIFGGGDFDIETSKLLVSGIKSVTPNMTEISLSDTQAAHLVGTPTITYLGLA